MCSLVTARGARGARDPLRAHARPQEAFDAINDVRSCWSGNIAGPTDAVGAEWFYLVPDIHFSKQLVTELVPARGL